MNEWMNPSLNTYRYNMHYVAYQVPLQQKNEEGRKLSEKVVRVRLRGSFFFLFRFFVGNKRNIKQTQLNKVSCCHCLFFSFSILSSSVVGLRWLVSRQQHVKRKTRYSSLATCLVAPRTRHKSMVHTRKFYLSKRTFVVEKKDATL